MLKCGDIKSCQKWDRAFEGFALTHFGLVPAVSGFLSCGNVSPNVDQGGTEKNPYTDRF